MSDDNKKPSINEKNRILREVQTGSIEVVKQFRENYPNLHWCELCYDKTGDTILHVAARLGFIDIIEYLLCHYQPSAIDCTNRDNKTALHEAAQFAQYDVVKCLLNLGANVNALKRADWTPLMLACTKVDGENNFKCVELLVQKGALINYKNKDGWTVLHLVCREGCTKILYLLLENDLNLFSITRNGRSGLHVAALHGHLNMVKALVHLALDTNLKDRCGNTPLHEAVLGGNLDVCNYLLSDRVGANVAAINNSGFGVLHLAASIGRVDIIEYLVHELKVNVNTPSCANLTPLHCAARKNQTDAVQFLLSLGANAYFRDNFGRCAAEYIPKLLINMQNSRENNFS